MFKHLTKIFFIINLLVLSASPETTETNIDEKSLFSRLRQNNMQTIQWEDEDWDTDDYMVYLTHLMENDTNPSAHRKRIRAYQFMQQMEKRAKPVEHTVLDGDTWQDLNLFCGKKDLSVYLGSILDRTKTELGKVSLFGLIANPSPNIEDIKRVQAITKELCDNKVLFDTSAKIFDQLSLDENMILAFWGRGGDSFKNAARRHYFNYQGLESLNESKELLELKSWYHHGSRTVDFCSSILASIVLCSYGTLVLTNIIDIPEWLTNWADKSRSTGGAVFSLLSFIENRWVVGTASIASGIFCSLSLKEQWEWAKANVFLENCIQTKLKHVALYCAAMGQLYKIWSNNPTLQAQCSELKNIEKLFNELTKKSEKFKELLGLLESETFKEDASFVSRKGTILLAYRFMHDIKKDLEDAITTVGKIDAYVSIAKLYKEFENKQATFCFAEFVEKETPYIQLNDFWNPFIDPDKVIINSVTLGSTEANHNLIITGPNAGGKSTILKAMAINLILAQSIGIVPAQSFVATPFKKIATYLNIADDITAGNSLFKSEVLRAQQLIESIENRRDKEFTFTMFDEIFSGTSPKEGEAAAYSVAKHLGKFKNNLCIIATHFPLLTNLEQETGYFTNYKVSVHQTRDGGIKYPFKLERGISDQHIAIDILRIEGFNSAILDDAYSIVHKNR